MLVNCNILEENILLFCGTMKYGMEIDLYGNLKNSTDVKKIW